MQNGSIIPIFHIFDIKLAQSFYLDYLGFSNRLAAHIWG